MKYFTKEYIKECNCEEIQELRKNKHIGITTLSLTCGDWILNRVRNKNKIEVVSKKTKALFVTFLPTGDQLDEEIRQIVQPKNWCYRFYFIPYAIDSPYRANIMQTDVEFRHVDNPLLAKIKLLKQLLKEGK